MICINILYVPIMAYTSFDYSICIPIRFEVKCHTAQNLYVVKLMIIVIQIIIIIIIVSITKCLNLIGS